jgi:Uma2 family endonuclease
MFLLQDMSWKFYCAFLDEIGDRPIRVTYDNGLLEIETPSLMHEGIKTFVGHMIETSLMHAGLDFDAAGSTTWRREDLKVGLEADESYYINHERQVRGKHELDLNVDPPPDLVVEVDIPAARLNKVKIHQYIGVLN